MHESPKINKKIYYFRNIR